MKGSTVPLALLALLPFSAATVSCNEVAYQKAAQAKCSAHERRCSNALEGSYDRKTRQAMLCSQVLGEACADFFACTSMQRELAGCEPSAAVLKVRELCAAPEAMNEVVGDDCYAEDKCVAPQFSWRQCFSNMTTDSMGFPYSVPAGASALPRSKAEQLLTLVQVSSADCSATAVARSYDGHGWEVLRDAKAMMGGKGVKVPWGNLPCPEIGVPCSYYVSSTLTSRPSPEQSVARFLAQSTFGPSRTDIKHFFKQHGPDASTEAMTAWIRAQMALPPSSMRTYFRQRTNPRVEPGWGWEGRAVTACEEGSRWHRFAFNQRDKYEQLEVTRAAPNAPISVRINGVLRTELQSWPYPVPAPTPPSAAPTPQTFTFTSEECPPSASCCVVLYKGQAGEQCGRLQTACRRSRRPFLAPPFVSGKSAR